MRIKTIIATLLLILFVHHPLHPESMTEEILSGVFTEGVNIDLREPSFCDGVLSTTKGGIIEGPDIRIQAEEINYSRKECDGTTEVILSAAGCLMIEYHDYIFIGDSLEYNFTTKTGRIINGRTAVEPWFFGGEEVELCADGSYVLHGGFITTSENYDTDWQIQSEEAAIDDDHNLRAKNIQLRFFNRPVFWLPSFKANLDAIFDAPLKYRVRWGGQQGPRFGVIYEFISWKLFRALLRLDYRFTRGPGAGIETVYENGIERCYSCSYIAKDSSIIDPDENIRYRFEGFYYNRFDEDRIWVELSYDKLSDRDMETDYFEKGLELKTAQRTQFFLRQQQDELWIANVFTRVRLNNFQTEKQELPTIGATFHPFELGDLGIISDNQLNVGYLNFKYSDDLANVNDYDSTRLEIRNKLYRPFHYGPFIATPEIGFEGIFYGNSPERSSQWLAILTSDYEINTNFNRIYGNWKHAIEPYVDYQYYTFPTEPPNEVFIFDIDDGWYYLNTLRLGCRNLIYVKHDCDLISRYLVCDLYTNAFFNTPTVDSTFPKIYLNAVWDIFPRLRFTLNSAWDLERQEIDHWNFRNDLTINEDFAIAGEYRHRSAFSWRKVDFDNFILDSFRSEARLRASGVSDRRDTVLLHAFYRFIPNWAVEFESRTGWNRRFEPTYNEFEVDLLTTLGSAWHFKLSYQHLVNDDRVALYVNVGVNRPEIVKPLYCH